MMFINEQYFEKLKVGSKIIFMKDILKVLENMF